ncbi:MAG: hypothetical protein KUL77_07715 [Thermomonas sp.]|jgi:hypothetical protein|uniref:hypothetical protein n=1 Tax=Thermomonas sp. TaxID=1971895 RepID=UPI001EC64B9C|nr:hypothetical protein [Thermomonas sp.]MBV2209436.1 hypothetical protein [Thermomonas sp.]
MEYFGVERAQVLAHCSSVTQGLERELDHVRGWNRLQPEHVLDLLESAIPSVRREARELAVQLARAPWRIHMETAALDRPKLASNLREVQIGSAGRDYRLCISEGARLRLENIVQVG